MKIKGQLLWMLILLTFTSPAFASNLYTSSTGSDTSNNCQNIATPCNLNNGFANEMAQVVAGRGDVIFMCAGACDGAGSANVSAAIASDAYTIPNGTDWSNALTIQAYPGEVITLSGRGAGSAATISLFSGNQYVIFSGFGINYNGLSGHTSGIYVSGSDTNHIRFQRMEVQNYTQDGITLWMGTHHIELLNVNSHDNGSAPTLAFPFQDHCIYIEHADDVLIDGGQYHNCAYGYGIHAYNATTQPQRTIVRNAKSYGNAGGGILVGSDDGLYYNNLVYNNTGGLGGDGIQMGYGGTGNKVYNNTIVGNGGHCVYNAASPTNAGDVDNNICWANFVNQIIGTVTQSKNLCSSGCAISSDPLFVNQGAQDFRLQPGSQAIGAGMGLPEVTADIVGTPRPVGNYDVGAYQQPNSGSAVLAAPSNVRIISVQ